MKTKQVFIQRPFFLRKVHLPLMYISHKALFTSNSFTRFGDLLSPCLLAKAALKL